MQPFSLKELAKRPILPVRIAGIKELHRRVDIRQRWPGAAMLCPEAMTPGVRRFGAGTPSFVTAGESLAKREMDHQ
jgi:hypothetical protein